MFCRKQAENERLQAVHHKERDYGMLKTRTDTMDKWTRQNKIGLDQNGQPMTSTVDDRHRYRQKQTAQDKYGR